MNKNNAAPKPRVRPRNSTKPSDAQNSKVDLTQSRADAAHNPERPPRVPMGATLKLSFPGLAEDPDFHYRVISERDGRLHQAIRAGYEYVVDCDSNNAMHPGFTDQYLMKIPMEWYKQDQKLKQDKLAGKLADEQVLQKDEYLPDGRHHVLQRDDYDPLG